MAETLEEFWARHGGDPVELTGRQIDPDGGVGPVVCTSWLLPDGAQAHRDAAGRVTFAEPPRDPKVLAAEKAAYRRAAEKKAYYDRVNAGLPAGTPPVPTPPPPEWEARFAPREPQE